MGYNTVAFLLNDMMDSIAKAPHAVAYGLSHPPLSNHEEDQRHWRREVGITAELHGEPPIHLQALEVLGTFHADCSKWLFAGGNLIEELKFVRYGKTKDGKKTVTLELPEWWSRK